MAVSVFNCDGRLADTASPCRARGKRSLGTTATIPFSGRLVLPPPEFGQDVSSAGEILIALRDLAASTKSAAAISTRIATIRAPGSRIPPSAALTSDS